MGDHHAGASRPAGWFFPGAPLRYPSTADGQAGWLPVKALAFSSAAESATEAARATIAAMPDTPIEPPSRQPYDPGLESRVERLEASMIAVQADIAGIRTDVAFMRGQLQELSSLKGDVARLASEVARLAIEVAGISGQLKHMPSTWAMIVAIMAGQATLAGVLFAALRLSSGHF